MVGRRCQEVGAKDVIDETASIQSSGLRPDLRFRDTPMLLRHAPDGHEKQQTFRPPDIPKEK
jgi:hypothetical protein